MSHLQYFNNPGYGEKISKDAQYSQSVRIGDRIEISGQGGWDAKIGDIPIDLAAELDLAFSNVELALKQAGGSGFSQVYKITVFYTCEDIMSLWAAIPPKWLQGHKPLLTVIGVRALALPTMHFEVEAVALVDEGKK